MCSTFATVARLTAARRVLRRTELEQDLGRRHGIAAPRDELDGVVEIDLAHGDALREVHGVAGLEEDVQPPTLDLRGLVLVPERSLGRLGHARGFAVSTGFPARAQPVERSASCCRTSSTIRSSRRWEAAVAAC